MPSVFTPFREKVEKQCKVRGCHARSRTALALIDVIPVRLML
jgi:hypothetical protein